MLLNATIIMIIGILSVYAFLLVMVGFMNCISFILGFFPEEKQAVLDINSCELEEIAAVIAIAKEKG